MLLEFKVANFRSIKTEQTLSFEPSHDNDLLQHYSCQIKPGVRVLKAAVLYGANASGKTNIMFALAFLRELLVKPKEKGQKIDFIPFLFDKKMVKQNGKFEITFFTDNGVKYNYAIEINAEKVEYEKLLYYPKGQPAEVYTRTYSNSEDSFQFHTGSTIKLSSSAKDVLIKNTIDNMTVVSAFSKTNIKFPELEEVFKWATEYFQPPVFSKTKLLGYTHYRMEKYSACKNVLIDMLKNADFNIKDITVKEEEIDEKLLSKLKNQGLFDGVENKPLFKKIEFVHEVNNNDYNLPEHMESEGTMRFYSLGGPLSNVIENGGILLIDELETSLHSELVKYFFNLFLVNTEKAQLIFSTHNVSLLADPSEIRKDVVWFTEKGEEGDTKLYSMDDFNTSKVRKGLNYLKAYNSGKFGARPQTGSLYLTKCENE